MSNMIYFKAKEKDLVFVTNVDKMLPDHLYGDVVRIRQIITNVLNNAVKYTDKGSVTLTVKENRTDKTDNGKPVTDLTVSVTDTGIGISEEDIGKLFGKFERVNLEKNSTKEGTGLGLAITKMLLDMMGGTISVQSVYGEGSTFTIIIPQIILSDEPVGDFREKFEKTLGEKKYRESFRAPEAKILIVDDTKMNLIVDKELLKDTEMSIDTASGGREAINLALKNKYDVILMDQRMPEMDGVETLHEIRKHKEGINIDTPVICLTADAVVGARDRYLSKGFNDYLTKPIDSVYLEAMLKKYIPDEKIETIENVKEKVNPVVTKDEGIFEKLQGAGIDTDKGIRYCGGDEDFYRSMLREYLESSDDKTEGLRSALEKEDMEVYGITAHSLKSTSGTIGANEVEKIALILEHAAENNDIDFVRKEQEALFEKYTQVLDRIRECI